MYAEYVLNKLVSSDFTVNYKERNKATPIVFTLFYLFKVKYF